MTYERDRPIPKDAMPVAEIIRKKVPRPKASDAVGGPTNIRFPIPGRGLCCPMGMLPQSAIPTASTVFAAPDLVMLSNDHTYCFHVWWDAQNDAEYAINQVWGEP